MVKASQRLKTNRFPLLWTDQKGLCLFCALEFSDTLKPEFDHLNNNPNDNRVENWALVCHACNNKKKNDIEMRVIAQDKLKANVKREYACERILADSGIEFNLTSSQSINKINTQIVRQFLLEHTMNGEILYLNDAVNAVVNLCQENNGTGSQTAIYRIVESLCNPINGKYTICDYNGKNIIRRRTEN